MAKDQTAQVTKPENSSAEGLNPVNNVQTEKADAALENSPILFQGYTAKDVLDFLKAESHVIVERDKLEKMLNNNKALRAINEECAKDIQSVIGAFAEISNVMEKEPATLMKLVVPGAKNPFEAQITLFAQFMQKYAESSEEEKGQIEEGKQVELNPE